MRTYIAYYRVSTARQGASGLGLESQQHLVQSYLPAGTQLLQEFIEVESGTKNNRPQLQAALAAAKQHGATLLIAKLDRLSRNARFIFALRDSGVDFLACDMPDANTLTVGIFAVIAQHERETISKRTKDALQAKKARGVRLGSPQNLTQEARLKGAAVRRQQREQTPQNQQATSLVTLLRSQGLTFRQIATQLNAAMFRTAAGKKYAAMTVQRLWQYASAPEQERSGQ
ncbi:recombinase family protein [Hymenobacter sp. HSC-4F20]|uniref:recombinase family protein n=1 Tax=Hymenobacter sp. HSC-4F20 TaxID=2864135 RepID=UPI001C734B33|nr:recombinase family protein [Hymenobacter sp. HSC-4F20]MBX0292982.1 recombinase family protein [Hymenobacter sp. HSC-4F20]